MVETTTDTRLKLDSVLKRLSTLKEEFDAMKAEKSATSTIPSGSDCEDLPPSPSKTASKVKNLHLERTLLTDQADDASNFIKWKEPPRDVYESVRSREDRLTVQTSASMTQFRSHLTMDPIAKQQKEWNFILFPPTSNKICISQSGFKVNLQPCIKEQQKTWRQPNFQRC